MKQFILSAILLTSLQSFGQTASSLTSYDDRKIDSNVLLQVWALDDTTAANDANANFRIRRTEVKLSSKYSSTLKWFLMFDPAKNLSSGAISSTNDNKILQDAAVVMGLTPELELTMGQFKIPTTAEGLDSSSELLLAERSYLSRIFGDRRETGGQLAYNGNGFKVKAMGSNGQVTPGATGTNINDTNNSKDFNARLDVSATDMIQVGVFTSQSHSTAGFGQRSGLNVRWNDGVSLIHLDGVQAQELGVDKNGMVATVGYKINDQWQPVLRYENFQNTTASTSGSVYYAGVNYNASKQNKVQLSWAVLNNYSGTQGSPSPSTGVAGSSVVLNTQVIF